MFMTFIGIDVSKKTLDVAALIATGELRHHQFCNSHEGHTALSYVVAQERIDPTQPVGSPCSRSALVNLGHELRWR